jgi:hypothetical protein
MHKPAYQVHAGNLSALPFGVDKPFKKITASLATPGHFNGAGLLGMKLAPLHSLHNFYTIIGGKYVGNRLANKVLRTMAKVFKKRFVTKNQFAIRIQKSSQRALDETHRSWMYKKFLQG